MHFHSAAASVPGLDVDEVISTVTVCVDQLPDAIVFRPEGRPKLQRAGLVVGSPGGKVDFHLAGASVTGFDVAQVWPRFVGKGGSQGPWAVRVWRDKGGPGLEDTGLVWGCCCRGSQQQKNEMPDGFY